MYIALCPVGEPNRMPLDAQRSSLVSLIKFYATKYHDIDKLIVWASNGVIEQWLYKEINTYDREKVRFRFYARMFLNSDDG